MAEDEALLLRAQRGDTEAFEQLVLHYRPHAVRFAQSMVRDAFYAEDIAQECFAKVYLRLGDYRAGTSFKSWLFAIIRNRCIDFMRGRRQELPLEQAGDVPDALTPENALQRKESWQAFASGWQRLPEDSRTALYLFAAEGMQYGEIARVMGKNVPQVKMMMYRARKKLKQQREKAKDGKGEVRNDSPQD